jgi:hypothetical protein
VVGGREAARVEVVDMGDLEVGRAARPVARRVAGVHCPVQ